MDEGRSRGGREIGWSGKVRDVVGREGERKRAHDREREREK